MNPCERRRQQLFNSGDWATYPVKFRSRLDTHVVTFGLEPFDFREENDHNAAPCVNDQTPVPYSHVLHVDAAQHNIGHCKSSLMLAFSADFNVFCNRAGKRCTRVPTPRQTSAASTRAGA